MLRQSCSGAGKVLFLRRALVTFFALPWLVAFAVVPAQAQSLEFGTLVERLDRLERGLQNLQRSFYRKGEASPAASIAADGGNAPSTPSNGDATMAAARSELRFSEIETQIRGLTGRVEEVHFKLTELNERLDRLTSDLELRLGALERSGPSQAVPVLPPATTTDGTETATAVPSDGTPTAQPPTAQPLAAQPAAPVAGAATDMASLSSKEAYNQAFSLLSQREYVAAERELKAFLAAYPEDSLVPNAMYWLGETYYVRNAFQQASVSFLQGYQKDPKGSKAPDNLLKLAKSLGNLRQKKEACATLDRLKKEFPNLPSTVGQRAAQERKRNACS